MEKQEFIKSYLQHKAKCIANANKIESAINQVTNLKKAYNLVMTGKEPDVAFLHNKMGDFKLEEGTLDRNKHGFAHVCRIDDLGHKEYYYISFSSKKYFSGEKEVTSFIISENQHKRTEIYKYIFITPEGVFAGETKDIWRSNYTRYQNQHRIFYAREEDLVKLQDNEEFTKMDFNFLSAVDATKSNRATGLFRVTIVLPSGKELVYEESSKRQLYIRLLQDEVVKALDWESSYKFSKRFDKGEDWVVKNGDVTITVKFFQRKNERVARKDKVVKKLGDIEKEVEAYAEKSGTFETEGTRVYNAELIKQWLREQPRELQTYESLRNFLQNPSLWNLSRTFSETNGE